MGGWVNEESFSDYTVLYGQGSNLFTQRHQNTRFLTVSILWFSQMTNLELCKRMFLIFSSPLERKNFGAKKSEPTLRTFSARDCPSLFIPSSPQPARRCLCFCSSGESKNCSWNLSRKVLSEENLTLAWGGPFARTISPHPSLQFSAIWSGRFQYLGTWWIFQVFFSICKLNVRDSLGEGTDCK